jgi:hypothetical protein
VTEGKKTGKSSSTSSQRQRSLCALRLYHRSRLKHTRFSLHLRRDHGLPQLPPPTLPTTCILFTTSSKKPITSTRTITLNDETVQDTRQQELAHGKLTSPWSIAPLETPQEELETEEVGLFKELEDLRDLPYQQQLQEYLDMLPRQVDPALAAATPIMEYLKTEVAYKVFVYNPNEWTGINGIDPVELKFREDMPERMPSKARSQEGKLLRLRDRK